VTVSAPEGITINEVKPIKINVVIEELVEATKPIKVNFIGQLEEGIEAGQISTQPEEIQVSGAKSEVSVVAYVKADVNTSKLTAEGSTIQAKAVAVNSAGDVVENVRLSSAYIEVTAQLCDVKEVPLNLQVTGQVASIYEVTDIDIPTSVKIKGTTEDLRAITALTAGAIDISAVSSTSSLPVMIALPEGVEFATGYESLTVNLIIKPVATKQFTYMAEEISIEGMEDISNIAVSTPQITITASGSESVIAGLNKEDLQPYLTLDAEALISATAKVQVRYSKQLGHIAVDPAEIHITLNQTQ